MLLAHLVEVNTFDLGSKSMGNRPWWVGLLKEVFVVSLCFVRVGFVLFVGEPMAMALTLGVLSSIVSVAICMAYSSWFGFTVFLGYVGGLVVVFCIVLRVAPNPDLKVDFVLLGLLVFWGADFFV